MLYHEIRVPCGGGGTWHRDRRFLRERVLIYFANSQTTNQVRRADGRRIIRGHRVPSESPTRVHLPYATAIVWMEFSIEHALLRPPSDPAAS